MKNYYPYPFFPDDVPIDISFVFEDEKPAGKHGFLRTDGQSFKFQDGTAVKFWGTNFNGAACFPEHDYSEKLAKRLAKIGINLVRMHQLDAEWQTPNMFSFTKGKRVTGTTFDKESMDRLDYLIYCLKKEGIYVYLDMITYRKFRSDEGVESAHQLADAAKPYSVFSRKLIELQKQFCFDIWTHENPYTKLKYLDEPAIVMTEVTNECDLFYAFPQVKEYIEPYRSEFNEMFNKWLKEHGIERKAEDINPLDRADRDLLDFKSYIQTEYFREMMDYMKSIGVKIPIAATNWIGTPDNLRTQYVCDFQDTHAYFYDWRWRELEMHCFNKGITDNHGCYLGLSAYKAHLDQPTYMSEWDMPWPNERRAESVLHLAAVGAFQGWSGFAIHTYSYSTRLERMQLLGKEISASKIGNTPYRQGVFSTWNDPAKFGLFYHAALITRRGDVKEGATAYGVDIPDTADWDNEIVKQCNNNIERHKIVTTLAHEGELPKLPDCKDDGAIVSDTGELYRDSSKNLGYIDSPKTKCVYGMLCKNGDIELNGMSVNCATDFAVIAMSSLTDSPICESDNILLTTVGRAQNTDAKFSADLMLDIGKPPVLIENIRATIKIKTSQSGMNVWAISAEGYYIGTVPTEEKDGYLTFTLGETSKSMYYLIVKS